MTSTKSLPSMFLDVSSCSLFKVGTLGLIAVTETFSRVSSVSCFLLVTSSSLSSASSMSLAVPHLVCDGSPPCLGCSLYLCSLQGCHLHVLLAPHRVSRHNTGDVLFHSLHMVKTYPLLFLMSFRALLGENISMRGLWSTPMYSFMQPMIK